MRNYKIRLRILQTPNDGRLQLFGPVLKDYLKSLDFEYSEFLKGSIIIFMFTICALVNLSKQCFNIA